MNHSAADRLHRLRWVLTLLFTTVNAVGLVAFAWLSIDAAKDSYEQRLDGRLHGVTSVVWRLVNAGPDGNVVTDNIDRDEIRNQCPQFEVLPPSEGDFEPYKSEQDCVELTEESRNRLPDIAADAIREGKRNSGYVRTTTGWARIAVEPFQVGTFGYGGAVVAYVDAEPEREDHEQMIFLVIGGCVLAIGGLGLAGHMLSGRAIRPAAAALQQQEVLLAETAHDLRTPVAALRALAETALRNPGERAELLPRTVNLASRMGGIIDGLLVRARLAAGVERLAVQPVWLDQLVTGLVDDTPADGANVTVTAAPTKVMVDPTLVQRAIGNLLDNALRYGHQPDQPAIVHISVAGGRVTVADHGPGVDGALAEEVFDRFRTGSGSSGLGLAIVRWVAQAHGGSLAVYNAEDAGAIFELTLPVAP